MASYVGTADLEQHDLATRVRCEQFHLLYKQLPASIAYTIVAKLLLVAIVWQAQWSRTVFVWLAVVAANQVRRFLVYRRFAREGIREDTIDSWERRWVWNSGISGLLWGVTAFVFQGTIAQSEQFLVTAMVLAVTAAAIPLISTHIPTSYAFTLPTLLPFIAQSALSNMPSYNLLGIFETTVLLAILSFARTHSRDVTDLLRIRFENEALAQQLQHRNEELRQAHEATKMLSRAKSQFFAAASHDLRQPLQALGLFAGALDEKPLEPAVARLVTSVRASISALNALFSELLDLSKIDAGAIQVNLEDFKASDVLDRLLAEFEPLAAEKGLRLSIRPCSTWLRSDPILLERILRNLLSNALRYTERGGVLLGARRRGERMLLEVWDTGVGIPSSQHERVFDEFIQLGNPERSAKRGLGLGLSIVKRLSDLLGGYDVSLASRPGRGTVFRLSVPLGAQPEPALPARPSPAFTRDIRGELIVVVEDDDTIVEGMKSLLSAWGAEVITSSNGDDVLEKIYAAGRAPGMIIADYQLEDGRNGARLIERLHDDLDPEIPAILLTGTTTPALIENPERLGCSIVLKPVDPDQLRSMIASKLSERAGNRAI